MKKNITNILKFFVIVSILICAIIAILLILNIAPFEELREALIRGLLIIGTSTIVCIITIFVLKVGKK